MGEGGQRHTFGISLCVSAISVGRSLSLCPCLCVSVAVNLCLCVSVCVSVSLSLCLSVSLSLCLSASLSLCPSVPLSLWGEKDTWKGWSASVAARTPGAMALAAHSAGAGGAGNRVLKSAMRCWKPGLRPRPRAGQIRRSGCATSHRSRVGGPRAELPPLVLREVVRLRDAARQSGKFAEFTYRELEVRQAPAREPPIYRSRSNPSCVLFGGCGRRPSLCKSRWPRTAA